MKTIGLIGGGNMGEALIAGTRKKYKVLVCEANVERVLYLKTKYKIVAVDLKALVGRSDVIVLAVKPQDISSLLDLLAGHDLKKKLIVSIAADILNIFFRRPLAFAHGGDAFADQGRHVRHSADDLGLLDQTLFNK